MTPTRMPRASPLRNPRANSATAPRAVKRSATAIRRGLLRLQSMEIRR
jgi:hypothetical protein